MWLSLASIWTLTRSTTGQHLSTGLTFRERPREKPLWPQNALGLSSHRWAWSMIWLVPGSTHSLQNWSFVLTILSHWQMESCTLAHLLISWEGTLLFSVPWETIIQSEQSSMIQDGWMVKKKLKKVFYSHVKMVKWNFTLEWTHFPVNSWPGVLYSLFLCMFIIFFCLCSAQNLDVSFGIIKWHHWALSLSSTQIHCLSWACTFNQRPFAFITVEVNSVQTAKTRHHTFSNFTNATMKVKMDSCGLHKQQLFTIKWG